MVSSSKSDNMLLTPLTRNDFYNPSAARITRPVQAVRFTASNSSKPKNARLEEVGDDSWRITAKSRPILTWKMNLVPATVDDLDAISKLIIRVNRQENQKKGRAYAEKELAEGQAIRADIEQIIQSSAGKCYVLKNRWGQLQACVSYHPYTSGDYDHLLSGQSGQKRAQLGDLWVNKSFWGTGVAQRLMELVESQLKEQGYDSLLLITNTSHKRSPDFYRKIGFTTNPDKQYEHNDEMFWLFVKSLKQPKLA